MDGAQFERVAVVVETAERTFRGYLHKPVLEPNHRLSDYLNNYDRTFLCLSEVAINDRGQTHRPGEKREFVAIATTAISFIAPMQGGDHSGV
jgi:Family of unknown function (DUF6812)